MYEVALEIAKRKKLHTILDEIKPSPLFSFQLDESTDVSSCSQFLVFVKYVQGDDMKEEFFSAFTS